jgi:hypothetical protein
VFWAQQNKTIWATNEHECTRIEEPLLLFPIRVAGADGVARVVQILRKEFEMAMALTGRPTIASIDRTVLW